jgi:hypothetical protein
MHPDAKAARDQRRLDRLVMPGVPERVSQCFKVVGLQQEGDEAKLGGVASFQAMMKCRGQNNGEAAAVSVDFASEVDAGHLRHGEIRDDRIEVLVQEQMQRVDRAVRRRHFVAEALQEHFPQTGQHGLIIHEQNAAATIDVGKDRGYVIGDGLGDVVHVANCFSPATKAGESLPVITGFGQHCYKILIEYFVRGRRETGGLIPAWIVSRFRHMVPGE